MTVDEIFSSESEHLYFRLIAARNALNAANDNETRQVLNEILDETLNNISSPLTGLIGFLSICLIFK